MIKISEENISHLPLYRAMGHYFANFKLGESTTWYDKLICELKLSISTGETIFSSLNYECLLEMALNRQRIPTCYFPTSLNETGTVIKPHGSCNFIPKGEDFFNVAEDAEVNISGLTTTDNIKPVDLGEAANYCKGDNVLYPAMALFRPDKQIQIAQNFVNALQNKWSNAVKEAEKIAIIGVKPRLRDEHIWGELAAANGEILYIGGKEPFQDWRDSCRNDDRDTFIANRFHKGFDQLIKNLR